MKLNDILKSIVFIFSILMILTYSLDIDNKNDNLKELLNDIDSTL
jgi:hypothetical protein